MKLFVNEVGDDYFTVVYDVESKKSLAAAAWDIAVGQSVGNPNVRSVWETEELFRDHSCMIIGDEEHLKTQTKGIVTIAFPIVNTSIERDGISHLLCQILGGQVDIEHIIRCRAVSVNFPKAFEDHFLKPRIGLSGMREYCGVYGKPLLGAIVKPKTGITPHTLCEMVKELVDGGVNFIKEDEILASPDFNRLEDRVDKINKIIGDKKVIYAFCINGDPYSLMEKAKFVANNGGNAVHANVWCGLGAINSIRQLDLPLFFHFQKSGDQAFTNPRNPYSISWDALCDIVGLAGVDSIHAGMWGGYKNDNEQELTANLSILQGRNVVPALSCGMHPGLIQAINSRFGVDYMANVGGAIHGHPQGTLAGVRAMRQAIDGNHGTEYYNAIEKWGKVD